jgi:hypothetical protein
MFKPRCVLLFTVLVIAALAACSDQGVSPVAENHYAASGMLLSIADVGPSEIVLCVDVSDSISSGELEAVVDALGSCLSDPSLVPQDGRITVSTVVYGDTIATITSPTTVDADNLANVIMPALEGLSTDRVVGGDGADLSGALTAASGFLEPASVSDRHVLIIGSGAADDPAAVENACADLGDAGVMVSAVGVDPDAAGGALLEGCAGETGGFYGAGATDLGERCAEALAYMLQVDIDLEPENGERPRGESYTVTAMVFRGGDPDTYPLVGHDVSIAVVSGPNESVSVTAESDTNGVVTMMYAGEGGPGTDTIVAETVHPGTGATLTDTATVTWVNAPPTCDAGGPYDVVVNSDTVHVNLDATASSDAEDDSLRYHWSAACGEAWFDDETSAAPVLTLTGECVCLDSLMVGLEVSDGFDTTMCEAVVYVDDHRPPSIEVREEPILLWPPNHKYAEVTPEMTLVAAYDACGNSIDLSEVMVVEVRSDEPEDHNGDGRTVDDIWVMCPNTVKLRAERAGGGDGRVYTIVYRIVGENGVPAEASARVFVPHDSSDDAAVESPGGYSVTPGCGEDG